MMTQLRNVERTFRLITENTNDLIIIMCEDGIIVMRRRRMCDYLVMKKKNFLGNFIHNY